MTVKCCPLGPKPQIEDGNGNPAVGYTLGFFAAGSSTPQNTYTDAGGLSANANPLTLNSLGQPTNEIWFTSGLTYKAILKDASGVVVWTIDNLSGINDTTSSQDEWVPFAGTPTFVSATSFTVAGDQTGTLQVGRRTKTTNTGGTIYSSITASVFGVVTTVTVVNDSGVIDSGLSALSYGLLSATNPTVPSTKIEQKTQTVVSATTTDLTAVASRSIIISGTTTITGITLGDGQMRFVEFSGALTLTNGASLILPGGANITTAAGDTAIFRGEASSVVRCIGFQKAIALNGKQPTRTVLTTGTGATYTTPLGATRLNVRMVGGGGGGSAVTTNAGSPGTSTTFGTLTAAFGAGGLVGTNGGGGGAGTGGDINIAGQGGGGSSASSTANVGYAGGFGGNSVFGGGGAAGGYSQGAGSAAATNSGSGGQGGNGGSSTGNGSGGGAGGYVEKLIVAPLSTYTYTVGAGGNGGAAGAAAGGNGAAGIIIVDESYN